MQCIIEGSKRSVLNQTIIDVNHEQETLPLAECVLELVQLLTKTSPFTLFCSCLVPDLHIYSTFIIIMFIALWCVHTICKEFIYILTFLHVASLGNMKEHQQRNSPKKKQFKISSEENALISKQESQVLTENYKVENNFLEKQGFWHFCQFHAIKV